MADYNDNRDRDYRVILAWIILALQILGLLWLLLGGRDRLAAFSGGEEDRTSGPAAIVEATNAPEPSAESGATAVLEATATDIATMPADEAATPVAGPAATATTDVISAAVEAVVGPERVLVESSAIAPEWLATLVEGTPGNDDAGRPPLPPHLLLTFVESDDEADESAEPGAIDLNRPQVRIIPIATLLAMLEMSDDEDGRRALQDLLLLLEQQPEAEQTSIPVPPILGDAVQNFVSRTAYKAFGGGSGIGYVTSISGENVVPVTNESGLNYVYQGLTADGEQYVFMSWPVDARFLPETAADVTEETAAALQANRTAYFDDLRAQVEDAADADISPSPVALVELLNSLSIDGQVAEAEPEIIPGTAFDALGFNWYWTGRDGADGVAMAIENPQDYSLVLWPDGTYSVRADCNVGGGTLTYDSDGTIQLVPGPLSRAMCPAGSRESDFIRGLRSARTIGFNESGDMILGLEDGGTMTLANVGPVETAEVAAGSDQPAATEAGLAGVTLQWPGYTNAAGETVTVDNPEDYLLTFLPDGTFNVVADCNVGGGSYTFGEDGTLQLGPIRLTMAACPDGSRGSEFVSFLENVSGAEVGDDGAVTLTSTDGGSATFVNVGEVATSTGSAGEEVAQPASGADPLNTIWNWTGYTPAGGTTETVGDPESYYLVLIDDGTYAFRADCNNGAGGYTLDGASLTLNPAAVTLAACGEESLSDTFVGFLGRVRTLDFDAEGNLTLTLDDDTVLDFANGGPFSGTDTGTSETSGTGSGQAINPLAPGTWRWAHFRDAKQDYDVSGDYTITFNEDGTASVVADCNSGSGSYTLHEDSGLTIAIQAITDAACPSGSLGDSFVEYLNQAGSFAVNDGTLTIDLMADGGTMTFVASQ